MSKKLPPQTPFAKAAAARGSKFSKLAELSGFSEDHVRAVARGEREGSAAFHKSMERILDVSYYEDGKVATK